MSAVRFARRSGAFAVAGCSGPSAFSRIASARSKSGRAPRKGRRSKIHALVGDRGRPIAFALTPGNVADIVIGYSASWRRRKPKRLLANKAYDADSLRRWLKYRKIRAAIPSTASRRTPYPLDRAAYRRRNVIQR
jgi:hypothetical protein